MNYSQTFYIFPGNGHKIHFTPSAPPIKQIKHFKKIMWDILNTLYIFIWFMKYDIGISVSVYIYIYVCRNQNHGYTKKWINPFHVKCLSRA